MTWSQTRRSVHRVLAGVRPMTLPLFLTLCATACSQPLAPVLTSHPSGPELAPSIATDSACRTVSITLVGSKDVTVTFPNRASCGSGLVLIPGGPATRSGAGKRNVNLPVRLLNTSGYSIQSPATLVLAPGGRVVLIPAGEPPSRIVPQSADSVRAGSGDWVWLVGSAGTVAVNDSTAARSLVIRLDSPVTTGQVTFTMEGVQVTPLGWILLTSNSAAIDTSKQIQRPGTNMIMYRTTLMLRFEDGVPDQAKQTFFTQNGLTVLGVTESGTFFVTFADPGSSITVFDAFVSSLRSKSGIKYVLPVYHAGFLTPIGVSRFPNDSLKRASWVSPSGSVDSLWGMRAIRAPLAWGCETGGYGLQPPEVALVEWSHDPAHVELIQSVRSYWAPPNNQLIGTPNPVSLAARDSGHWHAAATDGVLSAAGDNGKGIAGVAWYTSLHLFALRSTPERRSILLANWNLFRDALKLRAPRLLSLSIDAKLPAGLDPVEQATVIGVMRDEWKDILDALPGLLVVVAAGNEGLSQTAAAYQTSPEPALLRSALLGLRLDPGYADRILVVAGTSPGNQRWPSSNVFTDATDVAAPADNILVMDTVRVNLPVGIHFSSGTSLAAPMVAATAALLWSMDPTLLPSQVKGFILQGAQVDRNDSLTAMATAPTAVAGIPGVYQLDAYGALQLLSKQRPGTPICGYPVVSGGYRVLLQKNGPLAVPTDSIWVPGSGQAIGRVSVAQGGRRLAVYAQADSMASFNQGIIEFSHLGQRLTNAVGYRSRVFLERGQADILQISSGGPPARREVTLGGGLSGYLFALTFPDGNLAEAPIDEIDVSPDGRFVSFTAARSIGGQLWVGVYVQRFSDGVTTAVTECAFPCAWPHHPAWSHDGTRLLIASAITNPDSSYTGYLQPFRVDLPASGGFLPGAIIPLPGQRVGFGYSYTGDDALVYTCESTAPPTSSSWTILRAAAALQTAVVGPSSSYCYGDGRRIANVAAMPR